MLAGLLLVVGCASPGPPRAPSLHLPEVVTNLSAERVADAVVLTWTTPAETTDGEAVRGRMTAQVCREERLSKPTASRAAGCQTVLRVAATPGPSHVELPLSPALLAVPAGLLTYQVEIQNEAGRSAGPSAPTFAAGGAAPEPVRAFAVRSARSGALLTWEPAGSASGQAAPDRMQVTRAASLPPRVRPTPGAPQTLAGGDASSATLEKAPAATDPGGMLDRSVRDARAAPASYTYSAQRVRRVTVEGHALEIHGQPSAPVAFTYKDDFAPEVPTGLVAIASGAGPGVDLAWETNPETDLEGYNIYRRTGGGAFVRLNSRPLQVPAFRDEHVVAGVRYTWRVTAVRAGGRESAPGVEASEEITR